MGRGEARGTEWTDIRQCPRRPPAPPPPPSREAGGSVMRKGLRRSAEPQIRLTSTIDLLSSCGIRGRLCRSVMARRRGRGERHGMDRHPAVPSPLYRTPPPAVQGGWRISVMRKGLRRSAEPQICLISKIDLLSSCGIRGRLCRSVMARGYRSQDLGFSGSCERSALARGSSERS